MREPKLWQDKARELGGEELVSTIEDMAQDIHEIKKSVADLTTSAFPGGDVGGHKRYHELMITRNAELRSLRIAIQEKTLSALVWAVIAGLGLCIWAAIFKKGG